jgi:hypothetical protein
MAIQLSTAKENPMSRLRMMTGLTALVATVTAIVVMSPTEATARGGGGFSIGIGVYPPHYHHHRRYYYGPRTYYYPRYYYGPPAYYYPPPVYYYESPPPAQVIVVPAPAPATAPAPNTAISQNHCREYTTTMAINGQPQQVTGTACLQPDGTWRIIR